MIKGMTITGAGLALLAHARRGGGGPSPRHLTGAGATRRIAGRPTVPVAAAQNISAGITDESVAEMLAVRTS
jgi:hypothetical protein